MLDNPHSFSTQTVRALFNGHRVDLPRADFLLREISTRMQERLQYIKLDAHTVLDLGAGHGQDSAWLQQHFAQAKIVSVDSAEQLLRIDLGGAEKSILSKFLSRIQSASAIPHKLCADFARLPMSSQAADFIWSNLALHWHSAPDAVLREWARVLKVNGLVMFSCFGPDTGIELRRALAEIDSHHRLINFVDMHDLGDMLVAAQFGDPVMDAEKITVRYTDALKLLKDVAALGGNPFAEKRQGLIGRKAWARVLEKLRTEQGDYALTFEIIYGHAWRAQPKRTVEGDVIVSLDKLRKNL